jgi:hypothetical protein
MVKLKQLDTLKTTISLYMSKYYLLLQTLLCGTFPGVEPRFGSMGKPAPGYDLKVGATARVQFFTC